MLFSRFYNRAGDRKILALYNPGIAISEIDHFRLHVGFIYCLNKRDRPFSFAREINVVFFFSFLIFFHRCLCVEIKINRCKWREIERYC